MSAIVVLVPVMVAAWPTVCASVVGAAAALGFARAVKSDAKTAAASREKSVAIEVSGSGAVTDGLAADERLVFTKDGVKVTFERDERGKCGVHVAGVGKSNAELEAIGHEFGQQVVQQYAYHRLMEELGRKNFSVVAQEVGEDRTIHIQVRRFE